MNLCFVAHFAHRALTGRGHGHIGGVERQTALMARWLAARGHAVSVIVWDEGRSDDCETDGVRILKTCPQDAGLPGMRFFVPRWTSLVHAMKRADADLYYHNCAEYVTGQVALWARWHKRKFVYSVASDPDCDPALPTLRTHRERILYRYGVRTADAVIVQTNKQKEMLLQGFGVNANVLPMPSEGLAGDDAENTCTSEAPCRVLWIGRLSTEKRAHLIVDVARRYPQFDFDIVGPDGTDASYLETFRKQCVGVKNINLVGAVNYAEVKPFYARAAVLCCTSEFEGFPNTFLEAWSRGLPVVSTVDPDDIISRYDLGRAVDAPALLGEVLADLLGDDVARRQISKRAIAYFANYHEKNVAMTAFERLLQEVAGNK